MKGYKLSPEYKHSGNELDTRDDTTLHTNTTIGAINRLKDLGIDAYLISSSLNCVIAQRLLRKYCNNCKDNSIKSGSDYSENLVRLEGCSSCNNTGYQGRVAIFDYLKVDKPVWLNLFHRRTHTQEVH